MVITLAPSPVDKDKDPEEIDRCREIAAGLGVQLRVRSFIDS